MPRPTRDTEGGGGHDPARATVDPDARPPGLDPGGSGAGIPASDAVAPGAIPPAARGRSATKPSPGPRAADVLTETLRAAILSGALAPGSPLREEELSTAHGVSRHTARTALARLTAEHLASAEPYRGVRVSSLDDDALVALQQLRCALETEALRIVRDRGIHPPGIDAALGDLAAAEATGDWPATLAAHARVHLALVEAAGSPRIAAEYRRLDSEMHLLLTHVRPAYAPGSLTAEHRGYVEQALADPERAVRAHLDHSTRAIIDGRRQR